MSLEIKRPAQVKLGEGIARDQRNLRNNLDPLFVILEMRRLGTLKNDHRPLSFLWPEMMLGLTGLLLYQSNSHPVSRCAYLADRRPIGLSALFEPTTRQASDDISSNLGARIAGGTILSDDAGVIVVQSAQPPQDAPTSLTADAVIISSLIAKISSNPHLHVNEYQVQSNNGVVSVRAQGTSIQDAITIINLALSVAEVRQIIYEMPASTVQTTEHRFFRCAGP
jgi:hypothetical protein